MKSAAEDRAWELFIENVYRQRRCVDGMLPIALLLGALCRHERDNEDGNIHIDLAGNVALLWPPGLTQNQKAMLLARAAAGICTRSPLT